MSQWAAQIGEGRGSGRRRLGVLQRSEVRPKHGLGESTDEDDDPGKGRRDTTRQRREPHGEEERYNQWKAEDESESEVGARREQRSGEGNAEDDERRRFAA